MSRTLKNVGASVHARLQHIARERGENASLVLLRFANERLLFRLASSSHAPRFVLKGAALFSIWAGKPHRATRDLDLLGFGESGEEHIREVFTDILSLEVVDDGVRFDIQTLTTGRIREEQEYKGVRLAFVARVMTARVPLQVDVGFGDVITPEATMLEFPPLLDFPAPWLRAYPRETVIAEKLEAMVKLGMVNTRMKDFYDIAILARDSVFDGEVLTGAIRATFKRRKTPVPKALPPALTSEFAEDPSKKSQWAGFLRKADVRDAGTLADTVMSLIVFLEKPLLAAAQVCSPPSSWTGGGPWS